MNAEISKPTKTLGLGILLVIWKALSHISSTISVIGSSSTIGREGWRGPGKIKSPISRITFALQELWIPSIVS